MAVFRVYTERLTMYLSDVYEIKQSEKRSFQNQVFHLKNTSSFCRQFTLV